MAEPVSLLDLARTGLLLADRSDRARLHVTGPDRAKFLQNLTTNDIKRLTPGRGCEAFVTSPQGKTLGYVLLHALDDRIMLRTDAGGLVHVLPHFHKYGVFDDVAWDDVGSRTFEYHLIGTKGEEWVKTMGGELPPNEPHAHTAARLPGGDFLIIREAPTGFPGLTLTGSLDDARLVIDSLGFSPIELDPAAFESLRIAAGTPVFGKDVGPENLPQEVGRDARAISFVKGCYLGQETVARIDALGHVNKILTGLRFESDGVPPSGTALEAEGKVVGSVTSSAPSPADGGPIGLGYVRVAFAEPGKELTAALGEGRVAARVTSLPMDEARPSPTGA